MMLTKSNTASHNTCTQFVSKHCGKRVPCLFIRNAPNTGGALLSIQTLNDDEKQSHDHRYFMQWSGSNIPEHVQHIKDCKDHGHVTGRQKCGKMIHGTIEMSWETLLHEQCCELQHSQQQVLVWLMTSCVTCQHPRTVGITAPLQNVIQFVQHVHPVWQLTLHNNQSTR